MTVSRRPGGWSATPPSPSPTGRFFDRAREAQANAQAYDARARAELWNRSLELTGQTEPA
jgi:hypothetical protein